MPPKKLASNHPTPTNIRWPTPALDNKALRMSYAIARGEQGVLIFEPYKGILLPHWRFKTVSIAEQSSQTLKSAFDHYIKAQDFVGADMARKFIQMGMTRAKRYANHKGGRKYDRTAREIEKEGGSRKELPKSTGHAGMEEKLAASEVFKEVWRACTSDEGYVELRAMWQDEKKAWEKGNKANIKQEKQEDDDEVQVKTEVKDEDEDEE